MSETLTDEVGVVCFYLRKRYWKNKKEAQSTEESVISPPRVYKTKRSYCEKGVPTVICLPGIAVFQKGAQAPKYLYSLVSKLIFKLENNCFTTWH